MRGTASTMGVKKYFVTIAFLFLTSCATSATDGITHFDSGDYRDAVRGLVVLADHDNSEAQTDLGYLDQYGIGVLKDEGQAMRLFQRATAHGYPRGQTLEGVLYVSGTVIPHNYPEAVKLFQNAAAAGDRNAQYDLAYMYAHGLGVTKDEAITRQFELKAAISKDPEWINYMHAIYGCIDKYKYYPRSAAREHRTGKVTISFSIDRRIAINVQVVDSSGSPDLDAGLVGATESCIFPDPPPGILLPDSFRISEMFQM